MRSGNADDKVGAMNMRIIAFLSVFAVVPWVAGADTDDKLSAELRSRSLREVVDVLKKGGLGPPGFCFDKQLPKDGGTLFRVFLDKLRREREALLPDIAKTDSLALVLSDLHAYFDKYDSYSALLLNDCVKRMLLEWAVEKLRAGADVKSQKMIGSLLVQTKFEPSRLKPFFGREARPEWIKGTADLAETAKQLYESHGYRALSAGWPEILRFLNEHELDGEIETSAILRGYKPLSLALRMLFVESYRACELEGTLEFLKRGGDLTKVDPNDVRYFNLIMGHEIRQKFSFLPLGKAKLSSLEMLIFLDRLPGWRISGELRWMVNVFR